MGMRRVEGETKSREKGSSIPSRRVDVKRRIKLVSIRLESRDFSSLFALIGSKHDHKNVLAEPNLSIKIHSHRRTRQGPKLHTRENTTEKEENVSAA
jgi:hypothetical protein